MVVIYVLDVAEFLPIVTSKQADATCKVTRTDAGYHRIEAATEIVLNRKEMQMKPAVWYGIFTGGMIGEIAHWDRDEVRVIPTNKPL